MAIISFNHIGWRLMMEVLLLLSAFLTLVIGNPLTLVVVIGTRPDVIKLSSIINTMKPVYDGLIDVKVLCTGQHKELLAPMLKQFEIIPDVHLDLMEYSRDGSGVFVAKSIEALSKHFQDMEIKPDAIVVQGDTNTALAGAMAAFYCKIPVVHVEAGLRTWELSSPYPEEFNRRTISVIAALSLAPTEKSKLNLIQDGVDIDTIKVTGNTVVDSVLAVLGKDLSAKDQSLVDRIETHIKLEGSNKKKKYVLVSSHRQENFGAPLQEIIKSISKLSQLFTDFVFFFLLHMNPKSREPVSAAFGDSTNVILLEPLDYFPFIKLLKGAVMIVTDSGGMQEEASLFAVPCFVLRTASERTEGIEAGVAQLITLSESAIVSAVGEKLQSFRDRTARPHLQHTIKLYGDGRAGLRSACEIAKFLGVRGSSDQFGCTPSLGGLEYKYEDDVPLLDRHIIRDGGEEEQKAVRIMESFPLSMHSSRLFRPYFKPGRISVIITQYRRNTTEIQLRAIFAQTVFSKIDRIVIFQNEEYVDLDFLKDIDFSENVLEEYTIENKRDLRRNIKKRKNRRNDMIQLVHSKDFNYKYHGRFALALLFDSEFTAIFDDDTIPQPKWLEISTVLSKEKNAIVGPVGVLVAPDRMFYFNPPMMYDMEVDYTGHSWVFKTEWLKYMWGSHVPSWEAGEDIGFSALAWKHGRIRTMMPKMTLEEYEVWGDSITRFHKDGNATYKKPIPGTVRWPITRYWISQGWVPTLIRELAIGKDATCAGMGLYCKALMDHLKGSADIPTTSALSNCKTHSTCGRQKFLSDYITKQANAIVIFFEESDRPQTELEENRLKRLSNFSGYSRILRAGRNRVNDDESVQVNVQGNVVNGLNNVDNLNSVTKQRNNKNRKSQRRGKKRRV